MSRSPLVPPVRQTSILPLLKFGRFGGLVHQFRRKVVLKDIQRDAWLQLALSGEIIMDKALEKNLKSMTKIKEGYEAPANQFRYLFARGTKGPTSNVLGPPTIPTVSLQDHRGPI